MELVFGACALGSAFFCWFVLGMPSGISEAESDEVPTHRIGR